MVGDDGQDLTHRALVRRFARGRGQITIVQRKLPATRKGRNFPLAKRLAIWRAIFSVRPPNWIPGDRAAFGAIVEAHRQAAAECISLGMAAPRYRTIYLLWHRGVPDQDVLKALNRP